MNIYIFMLSILSMTAFAGLMVGVANDAVNFLNSAVGSKAGKRSTIMITAAIGVMVGTTFSSGMMEVARKGIFNPEYFVMHEVMIIFLAVMITDILLLDLYNTFGLPTSTTVSIVFEIFGGAVAIATLKIHAVHGPVSDIFSYINTKNVVTIVFSIGLSVVLAFFFGAVIQYITRVIFTFDYQKAFKRYGSIYCGLALTAISFFIIVKGAKGSPLITPELKDFILLHTKEFLLINFIAWTIIWQIVITFTRVNVLKVIVLIGTFALALAFAANDLVNFIGAPLGAYSAYRIGAASGISPLEMTMEGLKQPVQAKTWILLLAGTVMVITLWKSRRARSVTQTTVDLGRQSDGYERFDSSALARGLVRMGIALEESVRHIIPKSAQKWLQNRVDPEKYKLPPAEDGEVPAFDLLRAAVNLMVASALVSFGTSFKLPLSTTFVTFMVSMGTSLSDKAWGRESAVYRVNGVLTVLGGWFFTAFMAFSSCFVLTMFVYFGKLPAILVLVSSGFFMLFRSAKLHKKREERFKRMERDLLSTDDTVSVNRVTLKTSKLIKSVSQTLNITIQGLIESKRKILKDARREAEIIASDSEMIICEIFRYLQFAGDDTKGAAPRYARTIGSLQLITGSLNDMTTGNYQHIDNNHRAPDVVQSQELLEIVTEANALLNDVVVILQNDKYQNLPKVQTSLTALQNTIYKCDKHQMKRIKAGKSKSRQSLLFVSTLSRIRRIAEQSVNLAKIAEESLKNMPG
ncbi:inorganic phosphate transporter [candidate division KSB1 bacterium]|nr:inorganic phosphate transporter [candidate division KSB1 bacterium]